MRDIAIQLLVFDGRLFQQEKSNVSGFHGIVGAPVGHHKSDRNRLRLDPIGRNVLDEGGPILHVTILSVISIIQSS
jgi:hypothetical protein